MNPNNWSSMELFIIGTCLCLLLFSATLSTWQAFHSKTKSWLWRLYSTLIWVGMLIALYSDQFTTARAPGMPPEFAIGVWLVTAGIFSAIAHGLLILVRHVRQRQTLQIS
ncbi:hypothetical protein PMI16_00039 [Herbaspirillum sp. CF444]|uniref:hypothetical protein n=1 Tax=Herbaspirillum sp. CF444 TaxID=1144319 RepID=UPI0002727E02|nr:hypothetical protein [Herbaspirillum sp. CF444]EJL94593.1 hypothetical protein PMI16_00039 [Herbaspirillum sp. CF444]